MVDSSEKTRFWCFVVAGTEQENRTCVEPMETGNPKVNSGILNIKQFVVVSVTNISQRGLYISYFHKVHVLFVARLNTCCFVFL